MKKVADAIEVALKGKHGEVILYSAGVGLILSDIIPTPADAIYFHLEKKLRDQWKKGEITPEKYWEKTAAAYYLLNPIWWSLVLAGMIMIKGDVMQKAKIMGAIVGTGAVVGVIYKNYKKDLQEISEEIQQQKNDRGPNT